MCCLHYLTTVSIWANSVDPDQIALIWVYAIWAMDVRKPVFEVANNTGADQPGHPRSLISTFVIRFLESIICKLVTGEISLSS